MYHLVMTNSLPWKIPTINGGLMGKSSINGPFSMAMLNNQRVNGSSMFFHVLFWLQSFHEWSHAYAKQLGISYHGHIFGVNFPRPNLPDGQRFDFDLISLRLGTFGVYLRLQNDWKFSWNFCLPFIHYLGPRSPMYFLMHNCLLHQSIQITEM